MTINTSDKKVFELVNEKKQAVARIVYRDDAFNDALIETGEQYRLEGISAGTWATYPGAGNKTKVQSKIEVETGGTISIRLIGKRKKYLFKKPTGWKLRFSLMNKEGEELLTIIPSVNWQKESHDYVLQLNEEFENEYDLFLILQAVHCANCSLSMMTGGQVPPLISL